MAACPPEMRASGVRGLLVYCSDYRCSHSIAISGDPWPDDVRLSDLEPRFVCSVCGKRGADVRPDFSWNKVRVPMMGYRGPSGRLGNGSRQAALSRLSSIGTIIRTLPLIGIDDRQARR